MEPKLTSIAEPFVECYAYIGIQHVHACHASMQNHVKAIGDTVLVIVLC